MSLLLVVVVLVSCLYFISIMKNTFVKRNLPPGPPPLPLLGNFIQIKNSSYMAFQKEMRLKYGDIFTFYLGAHPVVVVSGYQALKEAFHNDVFIGRGELPCFNSFYEDFGFIFSSNMSRWKELRRFSLQVLRELGMGKSGIESVIQEEAKCLVKEFAKYKETALNPSITLAKAVSNTICQIMFGIRFDYEDKELTILTNRIHQAMFLIGSLSGKLSSMSPGIMRYLPGTHKKVLGHFQDLESFVRKIIDEHQQNQSHSTPRDYVDAFLLKMEQTKGDPKTEYNKKNLIACTLQIFFAGIETTSSILTYGILLLLKHPEIQENIRKEIDQIIGRDRSPMYQDRFNMPYTDAVMHEILRYCDLVPYGVPRVVIQDTNFYGYDIPKGTTVYLLLTSALNDPDIFPNPETFNPGNFLDEDGKFKKNDAFMAFSAGKRSCVGESLARMEIFLFITTILQNFHLRSPLPLRDVDISHDVTGFGNFSKPYTLCFESR